MRIFGIYAGRPSDDYLDDLIERNRGHGVTYDHIGSTLEPVGGGRPRFHEEFLDVGHGQQDFDSAVLGLRAWAAHRHIGARIHPADVPFELGADLVVVLPIGPLTALAPDRLVAVTTEPGRVAFSYGTLPGHPERGEESFTVALRPDGVVRFTIGVDAKPANLVMWLGSPVVLRTQRKALKGYLQGIAEFVAAARD